MGKTFTKSLNGERGGLVVERRTLEREVRGSKPTSAVFCPLARHYSPKVLVIHRKRWLRPNRTEIMLMNQFNTYSLAHFKLIYRLVQHILTELKRYIDLVVLK